MMRRKTALALLAATSALAVSNMIRAKSAERRNPPMGQLMSLADVRLHYMQKGSGPALVLLHGNGSMIEDFLASGLIDLAAARYRVIAFDRPGFGHTNRPPSSSWDAEEQAKLIHTALVRLGVERAIVLGHSWGSLTALALAFRFPLSVAGVILASGFYFPEQRIRVAASTAPATPVIGTVLRYTIQPVLSRLFWARIKAFLFGPAPVARSFDKFPREMALRPAQLWTAGAESGLLLRTVQEFLPRYPTLSVPAMILAGDGDRVVHPRQSVKLHRLLPHSQIRLIPDAGHMVHHTAPLEVLRAIDDLRKMQTAA